MAQAEHDDVADALARMSQGDVAPGEHEPAAAESAAPPEPAELAPAIHKPVRPAGVRPAAPRSDVPAVKRAARPVTPVSPPPQAVEPAVFSPPATSSTPARAAAPSVASVPAAARKLRPAAPTLGHSVVPTDQDVDGGQSTGMSTAADPSQIIDDDDSVIVPAPDASAFVPRKKSVGTAEARAAVAARKSLEFRRTLIPILFTCGVVMFAFGLLKFFTGEDSMLANLPIWVPITLFIAAAILIGLAVVNMLSVKQQLEAEANKPS